MFPGPTDLLLIGFSIESIWTQNPNQTSTPKTNLPTFQPKDISHVTNGIICGVCSILAIFTTKSRPMMSLIAKASSDLTSSASESLGKKATEIKIFGVQNLRKEDRTVQPIVGSDPRTALGHKQIIESSYSARYSTWDDNKAWSSQEWKADKSMDDRTGQPVVIPQRERRATAIYHWKRRNRIRFVIGI